MDVSLPTVSDDRDLPWNDTNSMASDDAHSLTMPTSPTAAWMHPTPPPTASASAYVPHNGQLSPISTSMDVQGTGTLGDGSAPTMVHSASSSCTDSWSIGNADYDDGMENEIHWEQGSDDVLTIPKLEPLDEDDFRLDDVKEAPMTPVPSTNPETQPGQLKTKRPRGRPRKHPLTPIVNTNKVTKGRSKTGCITCRKRKKKCDEAKPRCMNCEKNAVVCEGYPEKQLWKSGKEREEEERLRQCLPVITMQPIFHGLESTEDMIFWRHYNDHLSAVLTVEGEHKNAFTDMLIPIATKHQGLMHSILALASKHIDYETPYGAKVLKANPNTSSELLQQRSDYHHEKAMERLYEDIARQLPKDHPDYKITLSARYGQMLCLLLESLTDGNPRGEHRVHLQAYQQLIQHSPPEDPAFLTFITEFFQFHIFADELLYYPSLHTPRLATETWHPTPSIYPPRLLGVADGLFNHLCQITTIRNTIRVNSAAGIDPLVDYTSLYHAAEIDAAIRDWAPHWPPGDSRDRVGLLYKQMMWVYLFRTIYPPSPSSNSSSSSLASSLAMLPSAPQSDAPSAANTNTPPRSTVSSCTSSPSLAATVSTRPTTATSMTDNSIDVDMTKPPSLVPQSSFPNAPPHPPQPFRRHTLPQVSERSHLDRASSPPPIRRPPGHDNRITLAVDESLTILESIKPSDPSQTLLLIPCLVIGSACFAPAQRERIRTAVKTVRGYTGLRNCDRVGEVLEEVWRLMELGEWSRVWDWQGVARSMGVDVLCS